VKLTAVSSEPSAFKRTKRARLETTAVLLVCWENAPLTINFPVVSRPRPLTVLFNPEVR
jgi:hypothetical protein